MKLYASVILSTDAMRPLLSLLAIFISLSAAVAQPKEVKNALRSVAGVVTYRNGTVKSSGTALFVGGNGELLASSTLFYGADSAVVIDNGGKAHAVRRIVGVNDMFDCVKVRVSPVKNIRYFLPSATKVNVGDELFMLSYGVKKSGKVDTLKVLAVDSVYSLAYYTLDKPMKEAALSRPLLNAKGELVAVMQQASSGDTARSYAVSAMLSSSLQPSTANYGKAYYPGMGIRTSLPALKEDALSCVYMQAMMGDSASWRNAVEDYIAAYPKSYEGYQSLAEYIAIYYRDMERADKAWNKALSLADDKSEVYFGKGKVINAIVLSGDTVSHPMLSFEKALAQIDKAISMNRQPLYMNYKADMLYGMRNYVKALECYGELAVMDMHNPELFARMSQCHILLNDNEKAVAMLDSAVACFGDGDRNAAPYILTRALVKVSAGKHREAVFDMNRYEALSISMPGADFYYMREQAELNCKMYQQALNDIETAIDLAPGNILYYVEKGMLCYRVKLFDEGIRTMEKARSLSPGTADVHYLAGRLYMQAGDNDKARDAFSKALSLGHSDAAIQLEELK